MSQRDMLRKLVARYRGSSAILTREYAAAERRGEVMRVRNDNNAAAEDYARVLVSDARRKG